MRLAQIKEYLPAFQAAADAEAEAEAEAEAAADAEAEAEAAADAEAEAEAEAERIERMNLGYYAGYCSHETRERVEKLFKCSHPIFGAIATNGAPTAKSSSASGMVAARSGIKTAAKIFAPAV